MSSPRRRRSRLHLRLWTELSRLLVKLVTLSSRSSCLTPAITASWRSLHSGARWPSLPRSAGRRWR
eukprot:9222890-Lingulodinium_polyedra.AAC.1